MRNENVVSQKRSAWNITPCDLNKNIVHKFTFESSTTVHRIDVMIINSTAAAATTTPTIKTKKQPCRNCNSVTRHGDDSDSFFKDMLSDLLVVEKCLYFQSIHTAAPVILWSLNRLSFFCFVHHSGYLTIYREYTWSCWGFKRTVQHVIEICEMNNTELHEFGIC